MTRYVYILATRPRGPIYIGSAADLQRRMEQHRTSHAGAHTSRYNIRTLVWFEAHVDAVDALHREQRLKRWRRAWKDALIEETNPDWRDLSHDIPFE
ncbi:GIY-YIG nuclease family protein [Pontivivens ytuae]|uniref:GIY-YIG nuclease family protein n=1 Tax=Pontivivens ytuae TaxID=2789856 RepID=A0A7S9LSM4_9RHOB|nr:GIY-YIG nuclease family protein [Pontivivens ytuae]QPH54401.1 GIY-YIG nuclease family protein [Pontivivens ytuae]